MHVCSGLTLTEAQNINRSLLELGNVISALMQHSAHVPYRHAHLQISEQSVSGNICPEDCPSFCGS